ncbi:uncharacterized protein LOC111337264 isoform X2 [Stylophora pistillata]|uniref:uncharacterized protein LOC111337264 isoform X2 n=1 Tax=Stylophora pistillata TaxID=50429 RepID=UPI000C0510E7|nr:uncharacterized protein LOC111337264 isoform X2 [Stylophora pistillata]
MLTVIFLAVCIYAFMPLSFAVGDCPENFYWDGKECSACSGCPRGFGLKKSCTKTKNTECQKCYPGYDYSNSTGMEECIKCDTFSNCLPGRSKKVQECTIFSGPICDGCEEGYYHNPVVGCEKCSPGCDARTEDEIQACTTKHNRNCAPKRVRPKTPTVSNDSIGRGHPNITGNDEDGEIPPLRPEPVGSKSTQAPEENLIVLNPWLWVPLGIVLLVVVTVPIAFFKRKSRVIRRTRVEGDVHTYNTGQHIALQEQKTPLITEGSVDVQNGRDISSLAEQGDPFEPSHELDADPEGVVLDAPKPSSEELSRQAGLDRPIKDLTIKEKTPIITDLSGKDGQGYFYWQRVAEELGFQEQSRGWEGVQNPVENLLKTFGEREGSTIRGLIEATRKAELTLLASQWEEKFDTSSRDETTVSVHLQLVQGKTNDKFTSVDIPPDPGKENGANESVLLTPNKGKINDKADSDINVPADTGEETAEKDIADTAV